MLQPTRGSLRGVRAATFGVGGFALALVAHMSARGAIPGPVVLLLLAGLVGLASLLLTAVRLSPLQVLLSLATMQVVLHEAFMWLGASTSCVMIGVSATASSHMSPGARPMIGCATGMAQAGMEKTSVVAGAAMVAAHVGATAVMAWLLAYGEKVLWFLAGWVRPRRWLHVHLPEMPAVHVGTSCAPRMLPARFACGGVGLRGPPSRGLCAIV